MIKKLLNNDISYVEIKCQLDTTNGFFIADLIACLTCFGHHYAHHQEFKSIIQVVAACGIWCCGFQPSTKYHKQLLMMGIMVPETC